MTITVTLDWGGGASDTHAPRRSGLNTVLFLMDAQKKSLALCQTELDQGQSSTQNKSTITYINDYIKKTRNNFLHFQCIYFLHVNSPFLFFPPPWNNPLPDSSSAVWYAISVMSYHIRKSECLTFSSLFTYLTYLLTSLPFFPPTLPSFFFSSSFLPFLSFSLSFFLSFFLCQAMSQPRAK